METQGLKREKKKFTTGAAICCDAFFFFTGGRVADRFPFTGTHSKRGSELPIDHRSFLGCNAGRVGPDFSLFLFVFLSQSNYFNLFLPSFLPSFPVDDFYSRDILVAVGLRSDRQKPSQRKKKEEKFEALNQEWREQCLTSQRYHIIHQPKMEMLRIRAKKLSLVTHWA